MRNFVEEYGRSIVIAIVILALIILAGLCSSGGSMNIKAINSNFAFKAGFPNYKMLNEPDVVNAGETATFRSEAELAKFVEVQVDGKTVNPSNYTLTEGSTRVELSENYTDTLEDGKHTLDIISNDGFARSEFEVKFYGATFSDGEKISWRALVDRNNTTNREFSNKYGYHFDRIKNNQLEYAAFQGCEDLVSISIPESVTALDGSVFKNCIGLESISLPNSLNNIGLYAFQNCTKLSSFVVPDNVTILQNGIMQGCKNIKTIKMHNRITQINFETFGGCTSLTSISIPNSVESIGNSAFSGCTSLTSIVIPDSVKIIQDYAFKNCTSLEEITLSKGVSEFGWIFDGCTKLQKINIPEGMEKIGNNAFKSLPSLKTITIPTGVTTLSYRSFHGSENLEVINLPNTINRIDQMALGENTNLKYINFAGTQEQWLNISKNAQWNENVGYYTIKCSNGDIKGYVDWTKRMQYEKAV